MKPLITFILAVGISFALGAQTIFSTTLNSRAEFRQWSVIDHNNDGATWQYLATQYSGKRTFYNYHSDNVADDWLVSPAITPEVTGQYLVTYKFEAGQGLPESMKICYGSEPTHDALIANCVKSYDNVKGQHSGYFLVDLKANEPFYVGFYACSDEDMDRLYAQSLTVRRCENPVDLEVEEIMTPVSMDSLKTNEPVRLRIKNVGLCDAEGGKYKVEIAVDGVKAFAETISQKLAVNQSLELSLGGKLNLSVPHNNYKITATVTHSDDVYDGNNTLSKIVRHIGPADEPYTQSFEAEEDTDDVRYYKRSDLAGCWAVSPGNWYIQTARTGENALTYSYNGLAQASDWAIIDGIRMEAGYHIVKFWLSTLTNSPDESVEVYWGNENTPEAMTNLLGVYNPAASDVYKQKMGLIYIDKPQVVYVGFRATKDAGNNWICIDDIEINAVSEDYVDLHICSLINPTDIVPQLSSKSVLFKVKNHGVKDATGDLRVFIDGKQCYQEQLTVERLADRNLEILGLLYDVQEGEHKLRIELLNADDVDLTDNVIESTFRVMGTPDCLWNFEDGIVPTDFELRTEDAVQFTDEMKNLFGESGFAIIQCDGMPTSNGAYMLGVATQGEVESSADRWIVLPPVHVDSGNACLVANFGALSDSKAENYRIKVSENEDVWWDYTTLLSVDSESGTRKERGVELGDYYDKTVYIAINVTSHDGYALGVDNIALYDCSFIAEHYSGLNHLTIDNAVRIERKGDNITVISPHSGHLVEIYELSGRRVMRTTASTINISHLNKGFYCIRAITPYGAQYLKITK